jgi:hypothetical protein
MAIALLNEAGTAVVSLFAQPQGESVGAVEIDDSDARVLAFIAAQNSAQLVSYAMAKQALIANGGVSINVAASGPPIMASADTSVTGRVDLSGVLQSAQLNSGYTTVWVQTSGNLTLNAAAILLLAVGVGAFIEATYAALAGVLAAIAAGTVTTTAEIDAFASPAWPANS